MHSNYISLLAYLQIKLALVSKTSEEIIAVYSENYTQ